MRHLQTRRSNDGTAATTAPLHWLPVVLVLLLFTSSLPLQCSAQSRPVPFFIFPPSGQPRNASWSARSQHTVTVVDDAMILVGGFDGQSALNDVYRWSSGEEGWVGDLASGASPRPSSRFGHSAVEFPAGRLVVLGGYDPAAGSATSSGSMADVWASADGGVSWVVLTSSAAWSPRYLASVIVFGDALFLAGGTATGSENLDLWTSRDGATWTEVVSTSTASAIPPARGAAAFAVVNGAIYLVGGIAANPLNDVYSLDPSTGVWTSLGSYPGASADVNLFGGSAVLGEFLYLVGGQAVGVTNVRGATTVNPATTMMRIQFNPAASTFTTVRSPIAPLYPVSYPAVTAFRGNILVQGGEDQKGNHWNEVLVSGADYLVARPTTTPSSTAVAATGTAAVSSTASAQVASSTAAAADGSTSSVATSTGGGNDVDATSTSTGGGGGGATSPSTADGGGNVAAQSSSAAAGATSTAPGDPSSGGGGGGGGSSGGGGVIVGPGTSTTSTAGAAGGGGASTGGGSQVASTGGGPGARSSSSTGGGDVIGGVGGNGDGVLQASSGSGGDGKTPTWVIVLAVCLSTVILASTVCLVWFVSRRRRRSKYEKEERAQIDATLAAQAERERIADIEAQNAKLSGAKNGADAISKEERAEATKKMMKQTYYANKSSSDSKPIAAAAASAGMVAPLLMMNKDGRRSSNSKEGLPLLANFEPRSNGAFTPIGPPSVTSTTPTTFARQGPPIAPKPTVTAAAAAAPIGRFPLATAAPVPAVPAASKDARTPPLHPHSLALPAAASTFSTVPAAAAPADMPSALPPSFNNAIDSTASLPSAPSSVLAADPSTYQYSLDSTRQLEAPGAYEYIYTCDE